MWLSVIASVIAIGLTLSVIYKYYKKMRHPIFMETANKNPADSINDALASLLQGEHPPNYKSDKFLYSAGKTSLAFLANLT